MNQIQGGCATRRAAGLAATFALASLLTGCWNDTADDPFDINAKPANLGSITTTVYDGTSDDLLTAGLGKTGLGAAAAPAPANPAAPTAAELRRIAIFNNYRAILDISPKGGYGVFYGPNIDVNGNDTLGEGRISGTEYLAYADDGTGKQNVGLMVQVPSSFDKAKPCIVTAASSGSRGVYGAIGSAGEWGLKHGCAVAYTDKGGGTGMYDFATGTVNLQNGLRATASSAGKNSNFTPDLTAAQISAYNSAFPNRVAFKHPFSQQNPEKDWGTSTLDAVRMAFYVLNEQFADRYANGQAKRLFKPDNTVVIASSVSNGGGAAVAAAEQDTEGLIDGVAVAEPTLEVAPVNGLVVKRGNVVQGTGHVLYDYYTIKNLYEPCAFLSTRASGSYGLASILPNPTIAANRCAALKARGLLNSSTTATQAEESLDILQATGYQPEQNLNFGSHYGTFVTTAVAVLYANAYGRFSPTDNLCGISYAGADANGAPAPLSAAALAQIFATSSGAPPSGGPIIINNNSVGGPVNEFVSVSASTGKQDYDIDSAICLRNLWTGTDPNALRVQNGVKETLRSGNLHGKPAILVAGRADSQIPVNLNERPYFGLNKIVEGSASRLSYIEVTNAQHFDAYIDNALVPGYDTAYVPLHYYFIKAMDRMYAVLTAGATLPPSQVVRTTPRGGTPGAAPNLTTANLPPISSNPAAGDLITFSNNTVLIPE